MSRLCGLSFAEEHAWQSDGPDQREDLKTNNDSDRCGAVMHDGSYMEAVTS